MKFSTALGLVSLCLSPATALSIFNDKAGAALDDNDNKIPGNSPLEFCNGDHSDDLITIEKVDLSPNPPLAYVLLLPPHEAPDKSRTTFAACLATLSIHYILTFR